LGEHLALYNKAYFANQKFLKSKLVTKRSKLKLYKTAKYASETWALEEPMIQKLMIF
jgi:hypothetical protein